MGSLALPWSPDRPHVPREVPFFRNGELGYDAPGSGARAVVNYADLPTEELVQACTRSGDSQAWEEFVRRFHRLIASITIRVARRWGDDSLQTVDDLIQETYLRLCTNNCRVLRNFSPHHDGSFYGFLKVLTMNVAQDHFKRARTAKRGGNVHQSTALEADEESMQADPSGSPDAGERGILIKEIDGLLLELATGPYRERDRRIFWLYYRAGLTALAISRLPSIDLSVKGVESTLLRLNRLLRGHLAGNPRSVSRPPSEGILPSESF